MSKNLEKTYNPKEIEAKLYEKWCEEKYFHAEVDRSKKPFTTVMPPPARYVSDSDIKWSLMKI